MAKAFEIEGFDVNNNLTDSLLLLFKSKTGELFHHYDQLFDNNDIEILHNTRVSSRRLIALFKVFRTVFPGKRFLRAYTPLYNFKNLLGSVRENDVLLKMIGEYILGFNQQDVKAVMHFFAKLKNDNINARARLYKNKELKEFKIHKEKLIKFYEKNLLNPKKKIDILDIDLSFRENAALILPLLFEKAKKFQDCVYKHPRNKTELHRMRIKAKPLRYTMELYLKAFGEDFIQCYEDIKFFVEKTGDIHDIDVISGHVENYLKEIKIYNATQKGKKEKISAKSLSEYLYFLKDRRNLYFGRVNELLEKWESEDFKSKLEKSVSSIDSSQPEEPVNTAQDVLLVTN